MIASTWKRKDDSGIPGRGRMTVVYLGEGG